jgi:hypothetical protein
MDAMIFVSRVFNGPEHLKGTALSQGSGEAGEGLVPPSHDDWQAAPGTRCLR